MQRPLAGHQLAPQRPERSITPAARAGGIARWTLPALVLLLFASLTGHGYRNLALPLLARLDGGDAATLARADLPQQPVAQALTSMFAPSVQRWAPMIEAAGERAALPPVLIATVVQIESCGDPTARSSAGALGLMQVMPYHFTQNQQPLEPRVNLAVGVEYLRRAHQLADGDIARTLAGYNGGHGVIDRHPASWPAETQRYVRWGGGIYRDAVDGASTSPTLIAWMDAGGHYLCQQAEAQLALR